MKAPLILVAEGQHDLRRGALASIEQAGFRTAVATSPADLWRALDSAAPGAVILDTGLRGVDGTDLCRDLRRRSDVPIILVGAQSTEIDRVVGLEVGADDYMSKPYSPRELMARLRAVLRRGRGERADADQKPSCVRFDDWTLDLARHEVRGPDERAIELTAAEFGLLVALVDHAQHVVPRARLMELAGATPGQTSDRSIDVLVSRLRSKLKREGRPSPIVTIRGAGYMLGADIIAVDGPAQNRSDT
ncbi:MAG: response regulator transcription factor [Sphingobium sp.]